MATNERDRQYWQRVESVFHDVVETPPADRAARLDALCADDDALRADVARLLERDGSMQGSFLELPAAGSLASRSLPLGGGADTVSSAERAGTVIGRYKLVRQIGEGGFGVVYLAEQEAPVRRQVALKIIKPGMDTRQVTARFEAERQALALMDHPSIARVFDAGATESGRPYFAMELVDGVPITDYCDRRRLDTRERVELFVRVCQAIQHAHQKAILHRDIKPTNVLVATHDGEPVVKIIDFGIAKALHEPLTDKALHTGSAQMLGTPLYMSPEQAERGPAGVDTRTDIYSLGVLLYELLTGTTPFAHDRVQDTPLDELRRMIREEDPPTPSSRASSLGGRGAAIAAQRRTDYRRLSRSVGGDLDWIVMRSLEKDRSRRYETASAFAADLLRYLRNEPVEARPPSTMYRLRKLVRRNKAAVAVGGSMVIALLLVVVALIVTITVTWQHQQRTQEALAQARANARESERTAAEARAIAGFLVNDLIAWTAPERTLGRDVTVLEVLGNAEAKIGKAFGDQPVIEAAVRHTMGTVYLQLGENEKALRHLARACELRTAQLGRDHRATLDSLNSLARALESNGKLGAARATSEEVLERRTRLLGASHASTLQSMVGLASVLEAQGDWRTARHLLDEALAHHTRRHGPEDAKTLEVEHNLANLLWDQGQLREAAERHQRVLDIRRRVLGPKDPATLMSMLNLAGVLDDLDQLSDALELLEKSNELHVEVLGPDHQQTLGSLNSTALVLGKQGKLTQAAKLHERVIAAQTRTLGGRHQRTLFAKDNLANLLWDQGRFAEARALREEVVAGLEATLGRDNPRTLSSLKNLATMRWAQGERSAAIQLYREVLAARRRVLTEDHPDTAGTMSALADKLWREGKIDEAQKLLEQAVEVQRRVLGEDHRDTLDSLLNLTNVWVRRGKLTKALELCERIAEARRRVSGPEHPDTLTVLGNLASILSAQGRLEESLIGHQQVLETWIRIRGREHPATLTSMHNVAVVSAQLAARRADPAAWQEARDRCIEALELRNRVLTADHPESLASKELLAWIAFQRREFAEAARLYREVATARQRVRGRDHGKALSALTNLRAALTRLRAWEEACQVGEEIVASLQRARGPEHASTLGAVQALADLYNALASRTYLKSGQHGAAVRAYRKALALMDVVAAHGPARRSEESRGQLCSNLARLLLTCPDPGIRDFTEARARARQAVELLPASWQSWSNLAHAHYRAGDWTGTLDALKESKRLGGGGSPDLLVLAMAHARLGEDKKARRFFERAVRRMKDDSNDDAVERLRREAARLLGLGDSASDLGKG